jgi:hypothetical protein
VDVILVVRIVQDTVEIDFIHLGDGANIARQEFVDFNAVLALQQVKMANLDRPLAVADEELHVLLHRALMNAENANLAHVGIGNHLENVGQHMLVRIRRRMERLGHVARLALVEGRRIAFCRIRRQRSQYMQQFLDASAGFGRGE